MIASATFLLAVFLGAAWFAARRGDWALAAILFGVAGYVFLPEIPLADRAAAGALRALFAEPWLSPLLGLLIALFGLKLIVAGKEKR